MNFDYPNWVQAWEADTIELGVPLSQSSSFRFPLQSEAARREVLWGAALLVLLPGIGWLLNMGHRIQMVHNMHRGKPAWPAWTNYPQLLKHGSLTFGGMLLYYSPAMILAYFRNWPLAFLLFVLATVAIPGYMTHYCQQFELAEIFNPFKALSRVSQGGLAYWKAWAIALKALAISLLGLPFGLAFLVTSVWFWQVAGFSFATVFTKRFGLGQEDPGAES